MKARAIKRLKNPYFWIGVIATIGASANIELKDLISWNVVWEKIIYIITTPSVLAMVILALLGQWNNPTSNNKSFFAD